MTHATNCPVDADGFCQAHGWDCADFHLTTLTARTNRTLAARAAADLAGDALTAIHDALRAADGMPRLQQTEAFERAARALVATLKDAWTTDLLEMEFGE